MLAAMRASIAANDREGESTRKVGGVSLQSLATNQHHQPARAERGIAFCKTWRVFP